MSPRVCQAPTAVRRDGKLPVRMVPFAASPTVVGERAPPVPKSWLQEPQGAWSKHKHKLTQVENHMCLLLQSWSLFVFSHSLLRCTPCVRRIPSREPPKPPISRSPSRKQSTVSLSLAATASPMKNQSRLRPLRLRSRQVMFSVWSLLTGNRTFEAA